jgi:2,3-bisphosphoglycerate-independent phosphoglycerate mutase
MKLMKYLIVLGDGMADIPNSSLSGKTPLQAAVTPIISDYASRALCGMVKTLPDDVEPGSGPANMSVMGYDPLLYYTGRSPLEAVSMGVPIQDGDIVFRCNLVSLRQSNALSSYEDLIMKDYSAGEISTEEAHVLITDLDAALGTEGLHLYSGRSYRHCLVWHNGPLQSQLTAPHDITDKDVRHYLPKGQMESEILQLMKRSHEVLKDHPVNLKRRLEGKNTADSIWLWGQGTRPNWPSFQSMYNKSGAVISAVDLLFGIAICAGLKPIEVEGATGNLNSNLLGKAKAAIRAFKEGIEYVYVHVEAPDECGHQGDIFGKVRAIEKIESDVIRPLLQHLEDSKKTTGEDFRFMFLPDHPTPLDIRTHTSNPVPFLLYDSTDDKRSGVEKYDEYSCAGTGIFYPTGPSLFEEFIK